MNKALSVQQPWAWLIVNGYKGVENRSWDTAYRGELYIHAGKKFDQDGYDFVQEQFPGIVMPEKLGFDRGGIVGSACLINVIHERNRHLLCTEDQPWFFGEYGFILDGQAPCEFMPCKGQLGFFTPKPEARLK